MKNDEASRPERQSEGESNRVVHSRWLPHIGTNEDRASRLAEVLLTRRFEARNDPAPDALWDGHMLEDKHGKLIRYPVRVLRVPKPRPATEPDVDGRSPA